MGRDYRHRGTKLDKFEDGYEMLKDKKLPSYDRNKNRRQNKINLNHFDIQPEEDLDIMDREDDDAYEN